MTEKQKSHPELRDGEVFITNCSDDVLDMGFQQIGWKTKRMGIVAYGASGQVVNGLFPVFAKKKELEEAGIKFSE